MEQQGRAEKCCFNCGSTQHLARNCMKERTQTGGVRQSVQNLNTGRYRGGGRGGPQQARGGVPRGTGARSASTATLAGAEANGLHLQENQNGYENELSSMSRDGQYVEQEYLHEQYSDNMELNDNLMRTDVYRIEVQSAALTDLRLTGPNNKDSPIWAKLDKIIIKIGGVVSAETFLDSGSGINLVGPKFLEKFGAAHVGQKDWRMHVGRCMMKVPVYQCVHKPVKVRLADQREVVISKCLAGVVIESEGQTIKINVWIQEDSPTEDLSLENRQCAC